MSKLLNKSRVVFVIFPALISGCAGFDPEVQQSYQNTVARRDAEVAQAVSSQQKESYQAWANAVKELGKSESPNAQAALMALALQKPEIAPIQTQKIERPETFAEAASAVVPLAGIAAGAYAGGKIIDALAGASGIVNNITAGGNVKQNTVSQKDIGGDANTENCLDRKKTEGQAPETSEQMPETDNRGDEAYTGSSIFGDVSTGGIWSGARPVPAMQEQITDQNARNQRK